MHFSAGPDGLAEDGELIRHAVSQNLRLATQTPRPFADAFIVEIAGSAETLTEYPVSGL